LTSLNAAGHLLQPPGHAPDTQKTITLDRKTPQAESRHPGLLQSSQATVLELWASPHLLRTPWSQLDTSCSHQDRPQTHRKRPHLTGKSFKQKVVIQASSRALRPPFWSSRLPLTSWDLLGPSWTPPGVTWTRNDQITKKWGYQGGLPGDN